MFFIPLFVCMFNLFLSIVITEIKLFPLKVPVPSLTCRGKRNSRSEHSRFWIVEKTLRNGKALLLYSLCKHNGRTPRLEANSNNKVVQYNVHTYPLLHVDVEEDGNTFHWRSFTRTEDKIPDERSWNNRKILWSSLRAIHWARYHPRPERIGKP